MLLKQEKHSHDPGQYFIDVRVGLLNTNSSVFGSYVAVVSRPLMNVPRIQWISYSELVSLYSNIPNPKSMMYAINATTINAVTHNSTKQIVVRSACENANQILLQICENLWMFWWDPQYKLTSWQYTHMYVIISDTDTSKICNLEKE